MASTRRRSAVTPSTRERHSRHRISPQQRRYPRDAVAAKVTSVCVVTLGGGGLRLLLVDAHRGARADQVSISMHVVDAADGGPELRVLDVGQREGRRLPAVRAVPAKRIKIEKETTHGLLS